MHCINKKRQKKRYYENKSNGEYVKCISRGTQTDNNYDDIINRLDRVSYFTVRNKLIQSSRC